MPSAKTSVATVTGAPVTCSGAAKAGVRACGGHGRRDGILGAGGEQRGDPEVQQSRVAGLVDQNVGRLDVAVDDEVSVGVRHGIGDLEEQLQAAGDVEPARVGMAVDRLALDVLEDEIRLAGAGHACVEQAGDVRMRQPRQRGAFAAGTRRSPAGVERDQVQELDRGGPSKRPSSRRASHTAPHAAAPSGRSSM